MSHPILSRRLFLGRTLVGLTVVGIGASAAGCGEDAPPPANCGATGLTPAETQMRTQLGYLDQATSPVKTCARCQLYTEPAAGSACGGCQLNLGPVNPTGTCNSFVART